jgi:alcohol dehydrogenase
MMRQLLLEGPGEVRWNEADEPELTDPAAAIVRPVAVATCDLDVARPGAGR